MDNNNSFNNFRNINFGEDFNPPKVDEQNSNNSNNSKATNNKNSQNKNKKNNKKNIISNENKMRILIYGLVAILLFLFTFNQNILNAYYLNNANKAYAQGNFVNAFENFKKAFSTNIDNKKYVAKYYSTMEKMEFYPTVQKEMIKLKTNYHNQKVNDRINSIFERNRIKILTDAGANYIEHTPTNSNIIHWNEKFPITVNITQNSVPDFYITQIKAAFQDWSNALNGELVFKYGNNKPDIDISFVDSISGATEQYGKKIEILGSTIPSYSGTNISKVIIKFKKTDMDGTDFTANQIYNLSLHEIGHALGISGHSYNRDDVMYPTNNDATWAGEIETLLISKKTLSDRDVNTIRLLYQTIPDITNQHYIDEYKLGLYYPEIVFGSKEQMAEKKLKESQTYMTMISGNYISYMDLGEGYFATKNYTEAKNAFLSAVKLAKEPTEFYNAYYNIAVTAYEAGNYDEAIEFADIANSYNNEKRANEIIGFSYIKLKKLDKAQKQFEELVKENPDNLLFSATLTDVYFSRYNFSKAFGEIKRIKAIHPNALSDDTYSKYKFFGTFL